MIKCEFENGNIADPGLRHITLGVLVTRDGRLLLTRRANHLSEAGKWCIPGGYMSLDETLAEGARREVLEETGWELGDMQLFNINDNPNRPHEDKQNVNINFVAEATRQSGKPDQEVSELKWFDLDDLPRAGEVAFDHYDLLLKYRDFRAKPFELPVLYNR